MGLISTAYTVSGESDNHIRRTQLFPAVIQAAGEETLLAVFAASTFRVFATMGSPATNPRVPRQAGVFPVPSFRNACSYAWLSPAQTRLF